MFEMGLCVFQVTLTADTDCRYVSWRRKKLYLLFAQHRYISRLFSVLIGSDIADKLYALNDRVYIGKKHHYDIRLPNYYQLSSPDLSRSPLTEQFRNSRQHCNKWHQNLKLFWWLGKKKRLHHSPDKIAHYYSILQLKLRVKMPSPGVY